MSRWSRKWPGDDIQKLFFPRQREPQRLSPNVPSFDSSHRSTFALAVDPGLTTGLALSLLTPQKFVGDPAHTALARGMLTGRLTVHEVSGSEQEMAELVVDLLFHHGIPTLVMESFQLRRFDQNPNLLAPVRMISRIESLLSTAGWDGSVVFQPSGIKAVMTDARLREWGLWVRGFQHGRDATRHLVAYYRSRGK